MKVYFKKRVLEIKVKKVSYLGQYIGLMFRTKNTKNLLFEFGKNTPAIHSYFVFFTFLAVWLDDNNRVLEVRLVRPFTFKINPPSGAYNLVELPANRQNNKLFEKLVDKGKV
jgi:uncharacterized membrane protein (UPF0127 family)